jgi:hypothetical protein
MQPRVVLTLLKEIVQIIWGQFPFFFSEMARKYIQQ